MAHLHSVYDNDTHFKINPVTRQIENTSQKVVLMQNDHNSERFTFEIPRYIDGHDMSDCNKVEVHFINLKSDKTEKCADVYSVEDLQISPDSEDIVICSWLISQNATKYAGSLNFVLRYACLTGNLIVYQWYTDIHKGISVSESISNTEAVATEYSDVLETWRQELIEAGGGLVSDEQIASAVEDYFAENPIEVPGSGGNVVYDKAQNLTNEQKAQARANIGASKALTAIKSGQYCVTAYVRNNNASLVLVPDYNTKVFPISTNGESLSDNDLYYYSKKFSQGGQDGAFIDGLLFRCNESGNVYITDIATGEVKQTMVLDKKDILLPHANSVSVKMGEPVRSDIPFVFESGSYDSSTGIEVNVDRWRTQIFNLDVYKNCSISITNMKFIVVCYAEDGTYLGQINPGLNSLVKGGGQWQSDGTVITEDTLFKVSKDIKRIALIGGATTIPVSINATYDKQPIWLYANIYNNYANEENKHIGECCVYEINYDGNTYSNTLVQVLKIGFTENDSYWVSLKTERPYGNFIVDSENNKLVVYVSDMGGYRGVRWFMFDIPDATDGVPNADYSCNVVTFTVDDILNRWDTDAQVYPQGACCHDGYAWCSFGIGSALSPCGIAVCNLNTQQEIARFYLHDTRLSAEAEFIDFKDGILYYGTVGEVYEITLC